MITALLYSQLWFQPLVDHVVDRAPASLAPPSAEMTTAMALANSCNVISPSPEVSNSRKSCLIYSSVRNMSAALEKKS